MSLSVTNFSDEHTIRPASILVVDDDATVCRTIATFLKSRNYQVTTTQDGHAAIELLSQQTFDLVFLDLMMAETPGIKILKNIRKKYSALQLPVIMLTVSEDITDIVVSFESGANDYIIKPFSVGTIAEKIEEAFSKRADS